MGREILPVYFMEKNTILRWVANHMPIEVDNKKYFIHAGALLNPEDDEFIWVFDRDPYELNDVSPGEAVTIKPVENKKIKLLL
jgi:hypothetical protein